MCFLFFSFSILRFYFFRLLLFSFFRRFVSYFFFVAGWLRLFCYGSRDYNGPPSNDVILFFYHYFFIFRMYFCVRYFERGKWMIRQSRWWNGARRMEARWQECRGGVVPAVKESFGTNPNESTWRFVHEQQQQKFV